MSSGDWADVKEGMSSKINTPKGMAAAATLDAIILVIFGIVNWVLNKEISDWGVPLSATIWFIMAVIISISGYFLFKNSMIGVYIGWIAAVAAIVLGAILSFKVLPNDAWGEIYLLLTGIINAVVLLLPSTRQGLQ